MVPSALEFSSPPFPIWMMTTHPTAIISNINCSPKSWPKFPGTIISSFRFPNHFMEIFIIARTPLIIIYLLICLFIVLWILSELKRSLTYCIIQLNDWVKVSNYKLFLPENVGYLIQVNNYVYDDYFFFHNHRRETDCKFSCLHFSCFCSMYFICYYNQHLSCWTILGNSWLERIEGTLGVSTVLSKFPLANFWHVIYIPWVIKELSSTFFAASLWDIFSLHHNYSYEQKQKQGAGGARDQNAFSGS